MTQSLSQIRELLLRYRRANGAGSVKTANNLVPDILELLIDYVDEATGRKPAEASELDYDIAYFAEKVRRCEASFGAGSPECGKARAQLAALQDALIVSRAASAQERKVFYVDTGRLPPEQAKQMLTEVMRHKTEVPEAVDLSALSEADQEAYIEAQFRHQGITNNGARYTGSEERVAAFEAILKARDAAETCAPCTVQENGTSAIDKLIGTAQIAALVANAQADADVEVKASEPHAPKKAPTKRASTKKPTK